MSLTIQDVINDYTITRKEALLVSDKILPELRAATIYHHEWVSLPSRPGLHVLMIATNNSDHWVLHDLKTKEMVLMSEIDTTGLEVES